MKDLSARALSIHLVYQVVEQNQSLNQLFDRELSRCPAKDRGLTQELCYGVIRLLPRLDYWAKQLMDKPLKGKYRQGHYLILIGLYQLFYMRIPAHAAVGETVQAGRELKLGSFIKLFNGVLRNASRREDELLALIEKHPTLQDCHPKWLCNKLQQSYPNDWQHIIKANNTKAPMWLRINQSRVSLEDYQEQLSQNGIHSYRHEQAPSALRLESPTNIQNLPGFHDGLISIQDGAAQMAARLLNPQPYERILDACAAPGGKTCHLLEIQPTLDLTAIDIDQNRLNRVQENLERLNLHATLKAADASKPQTWASEAFDRILLDAPCSATGVIRRHPDIKWLRRADDIQALIELQQQIIDALWIWLKPGGTLLYATCSVLPEENTQQIAAFLKRHNDAKLSVIQPEETPEHPGWQLRPQEQGMDGFYYARLTKCL
ncbi:MAG: Ribosomal RNA small subunit methyltransferase B [Candidatus Celerinatantimonas neptuna]|nr:MAG: Ribosomal RNA small subunit methyltransferase B [Candidatus Celerinatantimonas neptuna]